MDSTIRNSYLELLRLLGNTKDTLTLIGEDLRFGKIIVADLHPRDIQDAGVEERILLLLQLNSITLLNWKKILY